LSDKRAVNDNKIHPQFPEKRSLLFDFYRVNIRIILLFQEKLVKSVAKVVFEEEVVGGILDVKNTIKNGVRNITKISNY